MEEGRGKGQIETHHEESKKVKQDLIKSSFPLEFPCSPRSTAEELFPPVHLTVGPALASSPFLAQNRTNEPWSILAKLIVSLIGSGVY